METADPASYEFSGPAAYAHRRSMDSTLSQNFPFYPSSYSLLYQASNPYSFAHSVGHPSAHSNPYQYFVPSQHPQAQPLRLTTEQPLQSLPEIRPAKNAITQAAKSSDPGHPNPSGDYNSHNSPEGPAKKQTPADFAFSTNVDVLMKAIQAKHAASPTQQSLPPLQQHLAPTAHYSLSYAASPSPYYHPSEGQPSRSGKKRKYTCDTSDCGKSFAQKTHLDIHKRAHTGIKPFVCDVPSCGQSFSQQGNLKTHKRRHTGEKPFECERCHKKFAQRGNVRAHMLTHDEGHNKFTCRLDSCGKTFTQLGNMKSHQNKFHASTLHNLTQRFSQIGDGPANPADRDMWEYFAEHYKNSNKGIKGRGKDRRISTSRRDSMERVSVESDESGNMRGGSLDFAVSVYGSSDGEDGYYVDRRHHGHGHGHVHGHSH